MINTQKFHLLLPFLTLFFLIWTFIEIYFFDSIDQKLGYLEIFLLLKLFIFHFNSSLIVSIILKDKIIYKNRQFLDKFSSLNDKKILNYFFGLNLINLKNNIVLNDNMYKVYSEIVFTINQEKCYFIIWKPLKNHEIDKNFAYLFQKIIKFINHEITNSLQVSKLTNSKPKINYQITRIDKFLKI